MVVFTANVAFAIDPIPKEYGFSGYNFASTRTRVFIGSSLEDFIQFDLAQQIGVRQEIGKLGIMNAGFMRSSIPVSTTPK